MNLSFQRKILITYLMLLLISVLIIGVYYVYALKTSLNYHSNHMEQSNKIIDQYLDLAINDSSPINYVHYIDSNFNYIAHKNHEDSNIGEKIRDNKIISDKLKLMAAMIPNALRITVETANNDIYSSVIDEKEEYLKNVHKLTKDSAEMKENGKIYSDVYNLKIKNAPYSVITGVYPLFDVGVDKAFAYIYVDMNFEEVVKGLKKALNKSQNNFSMALLDDNGILYNSENSELILEGNLNEEDIKDFAKQVTQIANSNKTTDYVTIDNSRYLVAIQNNKVTGWNIVQYLSSKQLIEQGMRPYLYMLIWTLVIVVTLVSASYFLSKWISHPIRKLANIMSQADKGQVKLYTEEKREYKDEIGKLIKSYNTMGKRINESISKIYIAHLNQKQTELKMLQFQINPHFLYNALNTISSIAQLEDVDYIPDIADSLSNMFRYNTKGNDFVTLKDEIDQISNYIKIESIRFPGRYTYICDVDDSLYDKGVLKFILQPIVENAIKHAFVNRKDNQLTINAYISKEEDLIIKISDNGKGIEITVLEGMSSKLSNMKSNTILQEKDMGIGIYNVNARIKNFYGNEYGVRIESELGVYTCVTLRLKLYK